MTRMSITRTPSQPGADKRPAAPATAPAAAVPLALPVFPLAQLTVCPPASPSSTVTAPIQARWVNGPGKNQVHWIGRTSAGKRPPPPTGKTVVTVPLNTGEERVRASGHRSMRSLYTQPDTPGLGMDFLAQAASQAQQGRGVAYTGPAEVRGLGPQQVHSSVPRRDPAEHRSIFNQNSGFASATQYNNNLGLQMPGIDYQIGHGMGHGEGGSITQQIGNLATISKGANGEMIPFDKAISGNTNVLVDTSFNMRAGTHRAESVQQTFAHKDYPDEPFHHRLIDADRPLPSSSEWRGFEQQASRYTPEALDAAATLRSFTRPRASIKSRIDPNLARAGRVAEAVEHSKRSREEKLRQKRGLPRPRDDMDEGK